MPKTIIAIYNSSLEGSQEIAMNGAMAEDLSGGIRAHVVYDTYIIIFYNMNMTQHPHARLTVCGLAQAPTIRVGVSCKHPLWV